MLYAVRITPAVDTLDCRKPAEMMLTRGGGRGVRTFKSFAAAQEAADGVHGANPEAYPNPRVVDAQTGLAILPDDLRTVTADTIAVSLEYSEHLTPEETEALCGKLWEFSTSGRAGVKAPDDQAAAWWCKLSAREADAIVDAAADRRQSDDKEIKYLVDGGVSLAGAQALVARRQREAEEAWSRAERHVHTVICGARCICKRRMPRLIDAVRSETGYSRHGAADVVTRVFAELVETQTRPS